MNLLNLQEERMKDVEIKGEKFTIHFISPKDKNAIGFRRRSFQGGHTIESMTVEEFQLIEDVATIDICTDSFPKGYDSNVSSINWDDEDLIHALAKAIRDHTSDIQGKLKKNKPIDGSEK